LGVDISFFRDQVNRVATLLYQLIRKPFYHLPAHAPLPIFGVDHKVEQAQLIAVKFVQHMPNDLAFMFRHHPDAVTLAKRGKKIVLVPSVVEFAVFNPEHVVHVASN
jgi:hypothetical protein